MRPRLVLLHGAATTAEVWRRMLPHLDGLDGLDVVCPERPCTGSLETEVAALAPLCADAAVAGVSGGATLGLELAARGVPLTAAVLHEPAAGSLAPGLLAHVAEGLRTGGVAGFGRALYGPSFDAGAAPGRAVVEREFAMFRGFEPAAPAPGCGPVLLTVGERSPAARHASVAALARHCGGLGREVVPGGGHAVHLDVPEAFAAVVRAHLRRVAGPAGSTA
ncbi:alpha/beta fold hydrolase [Streptomyces sp. 4N509B]|uniref:alpha/beta fold hydrolase n=1 Tax=Streptomyces sp. 4N509B TaxID=3457413 RepID=UPI003FD56E04